jgi:NADH-quinone oxidoreductase subunit I
MYCGICVDVCPFDALFWSPEFEYAEHDIIGLTHEREELREWMWTVPPPPAAEPGAETPKELATATGEPATVTRRRRPEPSVPEPPAAVAPEAAQAAEGDAETAPDDGGPV